MRKEDDDDDDNDDDDDDDVYTDGDIDNNYDMLGNFEINMISL